MIATDYVHTVHPETGENVVFIPGEALPEWALAGVKPADDHPIEWSPQPIDYDGMKVSELRELATARSIDTTDLLKADLVAALEAQGTP